MGAYKDKNGRWYVSIRYKNWLGEATRKLKRGFTTKRDALAFSKMQTTPRIGFWLDNSNQTPQQTAENILNARKPV